MRIACPTCRGSELRTEPRMSVMDGRPGTSLEISRCRQGCVDGWIEHPGKWTTPPTGYPRPQE